MDKLNKWLTLGANLGVIAGLIFVAFQIKQNTSQMRVEASYSINQTLHELNSAIFQDSVFAGLWLRGSRSYLDLNEIEKARFAAYAYDQINLYIFAAHLKDQGLTDVHTDIAAVIAGRFRREPGLIEFVRSIEEEWAASDELYQKLLPR